MKGRLAILAAGALVAAEVFVFAEHDVVAPTAVSPANAQGRPGATDIPPAPAGTAVSGGSAPVEPAEPAGVPPEAAASAEESAPLDEDGAGVPRVDETALRYFAQQGDQRRLEAEIARLQALYPNWTPPADPLAAPEVGDPVLDRLWGLYAQERYGEVREAIVEQQSNDPAWQVPADLVERLDVAEARQRLLNASDLDQSETVVRIAAEEPSLLTCAEVDVLWRVARAFAQTDRDARSLDVYRYILQNCDDTGERLASVQMAGQNLDAAAVTELLGFERTDADGVGEFEPIRLDLARQSVAAAGEENGPDAPAEDVDRLRASADASGAATDLLLLGWYDLRHGTAEDAERSFRRSLEAGATPDAARGLALALIDLDRFAEAEATARPNAQSSVDDRAVYAAAASNLLAQLPPPNLDGEQLATIVAVAAAISDANLAQQLGWYSYSLNQFTTANQWFATSLAWKPDEEPAAFGLALVRQRIGDTAGLWAVQAQWGAISPRIAQVGLVLTQPTTTPAPGLQPAGTLQYATVPGQLPATTAQGGAPNPFAAAPQTAVAGGPQPAAGYAAPTVAAQSAAPQANAFPVQAAASQSAPAAAASFQQPAAQSIPSQASAQPASTLAVAPGSVQAAQIPAAVPAAASPQPVQVVSSKPGAPQAPVVPVVASAPAPAIAAPVRAPAGSPTAGNCRISQDPRGLAPDAALARGWCLMEIDRPLEAAPAFEVALRSTSAQTRQDAAYGQSLAYLRAGLTDNAAVAATKAPQTRDRQLELEIALLTDQATTAYESRRPVETLMALDARAQLAPERLDLMVLRGYAYLELRRFGEAERVFQAAARAGSREGARGVNQVRERRGGLSNGG